MIKTVIVDDEIWVIKLIKNIVNWEELGYSIVGEADNCEDALNIIKETSPRLLITDIRIPGNDGLHLMHQAREIAPDIDIVVISGYSEFEYARKAMHYGAYSYLLKPMDRDELTEVLLRLRDKIESSEEEKVMQQEKLDEHRESRRQQLLCDIMQGNFSKEEDLRDININYCTGFCENKYLMLSARLLFRRNGAEDTALREELENKLYDTIDSRLASSCAELIKTKTPYGTLLLLNYGKKQKDISDRVNEAYRYFVKEHLQGDDYRLIIGKSAEKRKICELSDALGEAAASTQQRIYWDNPGVISYSGEYKKRPIQEIMTASDEKRLRRSIEVCDVEETRSVLQDIFMPRERLDPVDVFCVAELVTSILFQTWRPQAELIEEEGLSLEGVGSCIDNALSTEEIIAIFTDTVEQVKQLMQNMQKSQPERIATKVKLYIHRHYKEKLTLETICGSIYLSPPYVCSVFKQQESMTILEYLTDYRISIAKELLLSNRYHINDIMLMVGYNDPKYFVKVFKKNTGVTPSEYRKIFL